MTASQQVPASLHMQGTSSTFLGSLRGASVLPQTHTPWTMRRQPA